MKMKSTATRRTVVSVTWDGWTQGPVAHDSKLYAKIRRTAQAAGVRISDSIGAYALWMEGDAACMGAAFAALDALREKDPEVAERLVLPALEDDWWLPAPEEDTFTEIPQGGPGVALDPQMESISARWVPSLQAWLSNGAMIYSPQTRLGLRRAMVQAAGWIPHDA